jgi:hypothetical protein
VVVTTIVSGYRGDGQTLNMHVRRSLLKPASYLRSGRKCIYSDTGR